MRFFRSWFGLALGALLLASGPAHAIEEIVVALKPDKNPEQMQEERKSLSAFLSGQIGKPVEVVIPLTSAVIIEGMASGTTDIAYLSSSDMLKARERGIADVLLAGEIDGNPHYRSYWVSLKEKPYTGIAELKGKPIAFASRTSTSGYVIPMWDLHQKGLLSKPDPEEFFGKGNVIYGTGYVSAIERVLAGEAEAAAVSYYVLDEDKHLSDEQRARLKKVTEQGPVPTHVIAVRASLSDEDKERLRKALLELNSGGNEPLRDKVFTSKLVEVDADKHLAPLAEATKFLEAK